MVNLSKVITTNEEAILFERELYLSSLYIFSKFLLGFNRVSKNVHGDMIKTLESEAPRKIIVEPRGIFKTSICSISYPIWRLLKNPNLTILLDSEIYNNSKNTLRSIKGFLQSEDVTRVFGPQVGTKWDEGEIIIAPRVSKTAKEASITVGGIGTTKVGQHYDLIIGDDYNSPSNSETPEKCQKVIDHVRYNLNILNPGGEYLFIGTRYAERDVLGFLLKEILGEPRLAEGHIERSEIIKQVDDDFIFGVET